MWYFAVRGVRFDLDGGPRGAFVASTVAEAEIAEAMVVSGMARHVTANQYAPLIDGYWGGEPGSYYSSQEYANFQMITQLPARPPEMLTDEENEEPYEAVPATYEADWTQPGQSRRMGRDK